MAGRGSRRSDDRNQSSKLMAVDTMVEMKFTSRADGSRFTGFFPPQSMTPLVEYLLLAHALHTGATGELQARVEPATVGDSDEVVAFAVYVEGRPDSSLGVIPRDCDLITGVVNDVWGEVVVAHRRRDDDVADYRLVCNNAERQEGEAPGIRVIGDRPSPWRHVMVVPPVRPIDLAEGVVVGNPTGLIARVFAASVLQGLLDFLTDDLENERMALLHGELAITPTRAGLLPYVLYDGVSPLDGAATSHSIYVGADAQGGAGARPVAAIAHSHPAVIASGADTGEDEPRWGAATPSAVDLAQLRRGLPHVHQASFIASLPDRSDEPVPLTPYGYGARFGRIASDRGFWVVADDVLDDLGHRAHDKNEVEADVLCERSVP